jgi:hypothetical protein
MRRTGTLTIGCATTLAVVAPGAALAAAPKLPRAAEEYANRGYQGGIHIALVTSAKSRRTILAGSAPLFPATPEGGIYLQCSTVPRAGKLVPIARIPFPSFKLKRSHHRYRFARSFRTSAALFASSQTAPVGVSVTITGTAVSKSLIKGTVKVRGGPCPRSASFSATAYLSARRTPGN